MIMAKQLGLFRTSFERREKNEMRSQPVPEKKLKMLVYKWVAKG